jgi:hypothetical protein
MTTQRTPVLTDEEREKIVAKNEFWRHSVLLWEPLTRAIEQAVLAKVYAESAPAATAQWIPISEQLPKEDQMTVAVLMEDRSILTGWASYWHGASNKFAQWNFPFDVDDSTVTHWMPLPPPPEQAAPEESRSN